MLKRIRRQREKIEKLTARENDVAEKLEQLRQELAGEREALDEMEKEHLFSLMRERSLSLEETIALMEQGAGELTQETEAVSEENVFTGEATEPFEQDTEHEDESMTDDDTDVPQEQEELGSFFSGFTKRSAAEDNDFWQQ